MNPPNTIASDTLVEAVARALWNDMAEGIDDPALVWDSPEGTDHPLYWRQRMDDNRPRYLAAAQAALTAITDAGMAIVPREPTEAMIAAGQLEAEGCTDDWTASAACLSGHVWSAMLAMHAATHCNNNGKAE